jgi:hypothetical protein
VSLPAHNPALHHSQGWIIIKPMTCPQVGSSKISDNVLIGDAAHFLL